MSIFNDPGCTVINANTGLADCPFNPDKIVGMILIDKDTVFDASSHLDTVAHFIAQLQALTVIAGETRAYPIFRFDGMTDNTEDAVKTTSGYGAETFVRDGKYKLTFDMHIGGHQLQQKLRQYNKSKKKCLLVDDSGVVYGTMNSDGDMAGLTMDYFNAKPFKFNDGTNPATYQLEICLSKPKELNEDICYVKTDMDIEENVKGITDVTVEYVSRASDSVTVKLYTTDDRIDLFDTYSGNLDVIGAWEIKLANSPFTEQTVATAVANATPKTWTIGVTSLGAATYTIGLKPPATLRSLAGCLMGAVPAGGFESDTVQFTES